MVLAKVLNVADVEEPCNLPSLPSRSGTSALEWAQQTPEERKALAQTSWWHETVGAKIIAC